MTTIYTYNVKEHNCCVMKMFMSICIFLLVSNFSFGQLAKGSWMVGGDIGFVTESYVKDFVRDKYKTSTFTFSPGVGYFVLPRLPVGFKIQVEKVRVNTTYSLGGASTNNSINFLAGPFVRYYFLKETNKRINFFAEGNYDLGYVKYSTYGQKNPIQLINFLAGPVFFLNSNVGLELTIGYFNNDTKGQPQKTGIHAGLGFQIHLGRD